jgi:hypothetical protein
LKFDRAPPLYVAGGVSGGGTVYDAHSGAEVAFYPFLPPGIVGINDVVITRQAAYFTDTTRPFLGRVALAHNGQPGDGALIPLPANFGVRGPCTVGFFAERQRHFGDARWGLSDPGALGEGGCTWSTRRRTHSCRFRSVGATLLEARCCAADGILLERHTVYAV